jgi:hypothetical protein
MMQSRQSPPLSRMSSGAPSGQGKDGYWLSFNVHGRIIFCTQSLAQVYGCDAAQIHDVPVATLLPELPVNGNTSRQKVSALMEYMNRSHQLNLTRADGSTLPVNAAITSVLAETGPLFVVKLQWPEMPPPGG